MCINRYYLEEVIEALNIEPDGKYVDCTFGRGGHSQANFKKSWMQMENC